MQRAEHVDARAEQRVFAGGRDQDGGEVDDGLAPVDRRIDGVRVGDVAGAVLHAVRAVGADDRVEQSALGVHVERAHAVALLEQ